MDEGLIKSLKKMLKDKATDSIIIDSTKGHNCWSSYLIPSVRVGKPSSTQYYNVYEVDGIKIYVNNYISFSKEMLTNLVRDLLGRE